VKNEFSKLITEHQDILHKVCHVYCPNPSDREDLFQEIVYQLWKSYNTFRGDSKFTTWMYRVALNTAITGFKKYQKQPKPKDLNDRILQMPEKKDDLTEDRLKALYEAISTLNDIDKALIMLHLEENTYQEIAVIMGITETNVGVKLNRIKKKLKEIMTKKEGIWN
jgi:RNA polymerase sigma-70 factor (ECF subfamily)